MQLVPLPVETGPLMAEVVANDRLWSMDTSRQSKIRCQRDTETIFIRSPKKPFPPEVRNADARASNWTEYSRAFPHLCEWLAHLSGTLSGELGRVFLVRLKGNGKVYSHADKGSYYESRDRFHVFLHADGTVRMRCGQAVEAVRSGQIWWFDNTIEYELENLDPSPTIYLIIDLLPTPPRPRSGSPYKHFELLQSDLPIDAFLAELDSAADLWDWDTSRQDRIRVQRETSNIPLRGAHKPAPPGIVTRDIHASDDTLISVRLPNIYRWASEFAASVTGTLGRLTVVRLNPHGHVHTHIDEGEYYLARDRYHLVLVSPDGSEMHCGDEVVTFQEGELWWFDNKAEHKAINNSDVGRIHIIFDVQPIRDYARWNITETFTAPPILPSQPERVASSSDADAAARQMVQDLRRLLVGQQADGTTNPFQCELYVGFRRFGSPAGEAWLEQGEPVSLLMERAGISLAQENGLDGLTADLFVISHCRQLSIDKLEMLDSKFDNWQRGLIGLRLVVNDHPEVVIRLAPTQFLATNRTFSKAVTHALKRLGFEPAAVQQLDYSVGELEGRQYRLELSNEDPTARRVHRGRDLVTIDQIDLAHIHTLCRLWGDYLLRSVDDSGRMQYIYYPSQGKSDMARNNQIRQWMASLALVRLAGEGRCPEAAQVSAGNIAFNLENYYRAEHELGIIDDCGKVKLGAVALAALTLRETKCDQYQPIEESLNRTILRLWQSDGSFRTFLRPVDRNDCQNFYPGEALLYWSFLYRATGSAALLDMLEKSIEYYQSWHLADRNPAFVPWHTQACYHLWQTLVYGHKNGDSTGLAGRLCLAIFQMNDWLMTIQQWDDAPSEDCRGRFYAPNMPYGPPHASSTAVYLEGLVDAYCLARSIGDARREQAYRTSILRGIRSLSQLTFKHDSDMFYISQRERVLGGVATTVYDNVIRVDNVQHGLLALLKASQHLVF